MFGVAQTGKPRRNSVTGVGHHLKRLFSAGFALFLCCLNASGGDSVPTMAEAHEFLASAFQRYPVEYVVWYGRGYGDKYRGWVASYAGDQCHSELRSGQGSALGYAIDWSVISRIQTSDPSEIYFSGQIFRDPRNDGDKSFSSFDLYYPDLKVRQSAFNAFEVLRQSCQRKSKFD